jgi:hypothetical protein
VVPVLLLDSLVVLESIVVPVLLQLVQDSLVALVVPVLLLVALDSLVALESTVVLLVLESLVVPVLLLVAVESLVALEVIEWIIASACDSVEIIDVALAILAVKELMEEEKELEVVVDDKVAFLPKKLIFFKYSRNINGILKRKNY